MTYYYQSVDMDLTDYQDLTRNVADAPTVKMVLALEGVLTEAFAKTQSVVHVETGRLKAGGRVSSTITENTWTGHIHYTAMRGDVDYAWYEARRGGPHDFMMPAFNMGDEFADAIEDTWAGD